MLEVPKLPNSIKLGFRTTTFHSFSNAFLKESFGRCQKIVPVATPEMQVENKIFFSREIIYCEVILSTSLVLVLGEPGWLLLVSFNDSLSTILFRWSLSSVQHCGFYCRNLKGPPSYFPICHLISVVSLCTFS